MFDARALARVLCPAAALWLSACSVDSESATDPATFGEAGMGTGGVGGSGVAGTGMVAQGGTAILPEMIEPQTVEERCAKLDGDLQTPRPAGWAADSHCKAAPPSYELVFGAEIKRLDIVVTPETYIAMEQDLEQLRNGEPEPSGCAYLQVGDGCQQDFGGGEGVCTDWFGDLTCYSSPPASETEACQGKLEDESCTVESTEGRCYSDGMTVFCLRDTPPAGGGPSDTCFQSSAGDACQLGGSLSQGTCTQSGRLLSCQGPLDETAEPSTPLATAEPFWPRDPLYVDATVRFEGQEWTHVGYRFEGDFDLAVAPENKRPFLLSLDELENEFPETTDQRLYGFKELSFSPGGGLDPSYLRQVLTAEMFARAGVPTPRSSLVSVYLDRGDGPELLGLYAMTEVPGDPFSKHAFNDESGCSYKADGLGAHLLEHHPESFHAQGDTCPSDQYDVQRLINALNADIVDRPAWRERLGQAIQLPTLVRFFAANQANGNWDTYGTYAHNYYLYGKASGGPMSFVPWHFALSLQSTFDSDFSLDNFSGEWPLLQAVARDAALYSAYHVALEEIDAREYDGGLLAQRVSELSEQVRPLLFDEGADVAAFDEEIFRMQTDIDGACDSLRIYLDSRGFSDVY